MKRLFALGLLLATLLLPGLARADLITGFLADCTAVTTTTCTEFSGTGYGRQPIRLSDPVFGVTVNRGAFSFGNAVTGPIAGRAIYDAATGGNLVLILPFAAAQTVTIDQGDVGAISLTVTGLTTLQNAANFSAPYAAGGTVGTMADGSTATAGVVASISKGALSAQSQAAQNYFRHPATTTGSSLTIPANYNAYIVAGAGTIAALTLTMNTAVPDGALLKLFCEITVTSLTITAGATQTVLGTITTCGPSLGHEWLYEAGAQKTWVMLN